MQRILVRPDELLRLRHDLQRVAAELRAVAQRLSAQMNSLEWEAQERANVEARVEAARAQVRVLVGQAETMARFLEDRAERFREADQSGLRDWTAIASTMERLNQWAVRWTQAIQQIGELHPWVRLGLLGALGAGAVGDLPHIGNGTWLRERFPELFGEEPEVAQPHVPEAYVPRFDGTTPAQGTTNANAAGAIPFTVTSTTADRSRARYDDVINQFAVGANPRYAKRDLNRDGVVDTFCNIFAWDVTKAMGAEIPHWVGASGIPLEPGQDGARELNANGVARWLQAHGSDYGWRAVTAAEAQALANQGRPAVVVWDSRSEAAGHIAVVRPGEYSLEHGPAIAQAGGSNFNQGTAVQGFSAWRLETAVYYVHD